MDKKLFATDNLDLGAFLMLQGLRFVDCSVSIDAARNRPKAMLRFLDEKQNARDLERVFMMSSEKRFRDLNKYLLKEVHRAIEKYSKKIIEEQEQEE